MTKNGAKYVLCGVALEFEGAHIDLGTSGTLTEWFKILKNQDKLERFIHWGILRPKNNTHSRIKATGLKLEPSRYGEQFSQEAFELHPRYNPEWEQGKQETTELPPVSVYVSEEKAAEKGDFTEYFGELMYKKTPIRVRNYYLKELLNLEDRDGFFHSSDGVLMYSKGSQTAYAFNHFKTLEDIIKFKSFKEKAEKSLEIQKALREIEKGLN